LNYLVCIIVDGLESIHKSIYKMTNQLYFLTIDRFFVIQKAESLFQKVENSIL